MKRKVVSPEEALRESALILLIISVMLPAYIFMFWNSIYHKPSVFMEIFSSIAVVVLTGMLVSLAVYRTELLLTRFEETPMCYPVDMIAEAEMDEPDGQ